MHLSFELALFLRLISKPKFTFLLSLSRPLFLLVLWMLSDHCAKKLLPWLDGMLDADETYFKEHGESRPFKGEEGQFDAQAQDASPLAQTPRRRPRVACHAHSDIMRLFLVLFIIFGFQNFLRLEG